MKMKGIKFTKTIGDMGKTRWDMGKGIDSLAAAAGWLSAEVLEITPMGLKKLLEEVYGQSYTKFSAEFMKELRLVLILRVLRLSRDEIADYIQLSKNFRNKSFNVDKITKFKYLIKEMIWAKSQVERCMGILEEEIKPEVEFIKKVNKKEQEIIRE